MLLQKMLGEGLKTPLTAHKVFDCHINRRRCETAGGGRTGRRGRGGNKNQLKKKGRAPGEALYLNASEERINLFKERLSQEGGGKERGGREWKEGKKEKGSNRTLRVRTLSTSSLEEFSREDGGQVLTKEPGRGKRKGARGGVTENLRKKV